MQIRALWYETSPHKMLIKEQFHTIPTNGSNKKFYSEQNLYEH